MPTIEIPDIVEVIEKEGVKLTQKGRNLSLQEVENSYIKLEVKTNDRTENCR